MLRDRLIFGLIHADGFFMQSRNFRLQRVGDINWLEKNYRLQETSFSIDELLIVDASRKSKNIYKFGESVGEIAEKVFIPIAAGGGIRSVKDAESLFKNGADKLVINTAFKSNPDAVRSIIAKYGSQCVIASVDYKLINGRPTVFIENGSQEIPEELGAYLTLLKNFDVGEILLNSIDYDGTGFGFDLSTIAVHARTLKIPLIAMGGAGNSAHLKAALGIDGVSSVATANLFNFIGNGLPLARSDLLDSSFNLAAWN